MKQLLCRPAAAIQTGLCNDVMVLKIEQYQNEEVSDEERARRNALQGPEAGAFLLATPKGDCKFLSNHFRLACILRLGMQQPAVATDSQLTVKCVCGKTIDSSGKHLLLCKRGGEIIDRHDAIVRTIRQLAARAGTKCTYSPKGCFPLPFIDDNGKVSEFGDLTPDLRCQFMGSGSKPVVVDIRITDSTCASRLGVGIERSEKEKVSKYGLAADANGLKFVPLVMEVLGKWSRTMSAFVKQLVQLVVEQDPGGIPMHILIGYWRRRISCVLQKYNAITIISRFTRAYTNHSSNDCNLYDESNNPVIVETCNV